MKSIEQMTNDEFFEFVVDYQLKGWIPLKMYLRLFPTETRSAIEQRLKKGFWKRGVHYSVPQGGDAWVNLTAIQQWVVQSEAPVAGQ